jgi:hypothetical protein
MTSKRTISALNEGALNARVVRPILFLRLDFFTGVKRFHTEIGDRDAVHPIFGNETYTGVGDFGGISSNITESIAQAPQAVKFSLTEAMFGFDDENATLIDDPVIVWSGFMDKVDITLGNNTAEMTMTCESRATIGQQSSDLRFSDEDLQAAVTGELGGEYIFRTRTAAEGSADECRIASRIPKRISAASICARQIRLRVVRIRRRESRVGS